MSEGAEPTPPTPEVAPCDQSWSNTVDWADPATRRELLAAFFRRIDVEELPERRRLAWRVGDAAREIIERLVDTRATDVDLAATATELEAVAVRLRQFDHGRRYDGYGEAATAGGGPPMGHADFSPLIGRANPLAPPMEFELGGTDDEPVVSASVTFGSAYEGPPGCVHGGLVAAAFDEILGATQALSGNPGMTGNLSVSYRSPTPLHAELSFRAQLDRVEGRKIYVSATLHAGETLCATCTGLFISVDFERLAEMQHRRNTSS